MTDEQSTGDAEASAPDPFADVRGLEFHVDGGLVPATEATVSVRDRGFMYGDAAFETMRAYGGRVFRWEAHAERLAGACETLAIDHGLADGELRARVRETLAANELTDAYVKLSISRGVQPGTLTPSPAADPTVVVQVRPLPRGGVDGDPVWDEPAVAQTVTAQRPPDDVLPSDAKTHNYLPGILAKLELRVSDADVALVRDDDGNVVETATSNLFLVRDDALITPPTAAPILPGITRDTVVELAESEGIPVREASPSPADVRAASEAFVTNSTWQLRPLGTVDGVAVGGGPVTDLISRLFDARVERDHYD